MVKCRALGKGIEVYLRTEREGALHEWVYLGPHCVHECGNLDRYECWGIKRRHGETFEIVLNMSPRMDPHEYMFIVSINGHYLPYDFGFDLDRAPIVISDWKAQADEPGDRPFRFGDPHPGGDEQCAIELFKGHWKHRHLRRTGRTSNHLVAEHPEGGEWVFEPIGGKKAVPVHRIDFVINTAEYFWNNQYRPRAKRTGTNHQPEPSSDASQSSGTLPDS